MIKIITGIRRCGKSYLLFNLYKAHFLSAMVSPDPIITLELDDRINKQYRNPDFLCSYVRENIKDDKMYYILLDEVQMMDDFEDILNIFLHISNVDVDVTGSNAKFLSKDIITEFRGRGEQVHLFPFSFSEFMQGYPNGEYQGWLEYILYEEMPKLLEMKNEADKTSYLNSVISQTYIKDILEHNDIRNSGELEELLDFGRINKS